MRIEATIIADSRAPNGARLTTFVLDYPRFVHAEFMTHRVFSRNASSSRAVPVRRQLGRMRAGLVVPRYVGAAQPGMQAHRELSGWRRRAALGVWRATGRVAMLGASTLARLGVHKQLANRVTEPWSQISVICSATDFTGFFALRCHPMAQPEIRALAERMREALAASEAVAVAAGGWHLPFVSAAERAGSDDWAHLARLSVAHCARVSYLNHDGTTPRPEADLALVGRLLGADPPHASPTEHQARASRGMAADAPSGNLRGWQQYRQILLAPAA